MSTHAHNFWAPRRYALGQALRRLRARPCTFFFAVLAAAAALLPPVLCALIAQQSWPLQFSVAPELSVFVTLDARAAEVKALTRKLEQLDAAQGVRLVPRDEALTQLTTRGGLGALPNFKVNPLPDVLIVQLRETTRAEDIDTLAGQIRKWSQVDSVVADAAWYRKWQQWRALAWGVAVAVIALAALLITWVVVVATRLHATVDRDELHLLNLVGANTRFMRRPYVYLGALSLMLAMSLAMIAAHLLVQAALPQLSELLTLYGLTFRWSPPDVLAAGSLIGGAGLAGGLLGGLGSFFASQS